ncbi:MULTISPECIES: fimbrial-like protein [Providencia]|uniref:fimbrial-like protein n=1 Tax=Providencia TaxID=586 RepID=UPI0018A7D6B9|nr:MULTISPECIES: fimbrial-like protein [Providencia]
MSFSCIRTVPAGGSDSALINFSAVFVGGSCVISTSETQIIFGSGDLISPATIVSSPPQTSFNVVLSSCSGQGLTPKITISGESTVLYGPALFRDPMPVSASEGYGILLSTSGNSSFNSNENLAQNKIISVKNWSTQTQLSDLDTILPVKAELTCGNCDYSGRSSGDLQATVTFNFVYD